MTEADTCRKFVVPLLQQAGWAEDLYSTVLRLSTLDNLARERFRSQLSTSLSGNVNEIIGEFADAHQLRVAANQLQSLLYAG